MKASSKTGVAAKPAVAARSSFAPPPPQGKGRAFMLALLIHALLVLALAWGLRWKKEAQDMAVDAELWAATAQTAAPKAAPVRPPPPPVVPPPRPVPPVVPPPRPMPTPAPKPAPQVDDDSARQAELALEQQKKREQRLEEQRKAKQAREQAQRQEQERQRAQAQAIKDALAAAEADAEKQKAAEQKAAEAKAAQQKAQAEQQAKADAARRQATLDKLKKLAGADQAGMANAAVSGQGKTASGNAPRDAGPSAGYGAKVRALVKPNITYPDLSSISGNPKAEVLVTASPDGTITDRHLRKSSGIPSWDAAVLRAIDKTQTLPRDVDGRVPSPIIIGFTPND